MSDANLIEEAAKLSTPLGDDVTEAAKVLEAQDSQYNRRAFVRAVFASVEANTFILKQVCLARSDEQRFSDAEMALLREDSYSLSSTGEPVIQSKFLPLDQNFRFAIQMFMRGTPDFKLDLGDRGWEAFKKAIQIRHRITHPKKLELLNIGDEELEMVKYAYGWHSRILLKTALLTLSHVNCQIRSKHESIERMRAEVSNLREQASNLRALGQPKV